MPMIGLTPCFFASLWNDQAPNRQPWSVRASAGSSNSFVRATRSGIRLAPSRSEYSECVWRWTKLKRHRRAGGGNAEIYHLGQTGGTVASHPGRRGAGGAILVETVPARA